MISPDRTWVRRWQKRIHLHVKGNAVLRRDRRAAPSPWRRQFSWSKLRWVVPIVFFLVAVAGIPAERFFAFGVLWTLCVTFSRANQTQSLFNDPAQLAFFFQLPVTNDATFQHQKKILMRSSIWIGIDWLCAVTGMAWGLENWSLGVAAPLIATAQAGVALAIALWLVRKFPRFPFAIAPFVCWVSIIVSSQLYEVHSAFGESIRAFIHSLQFLTPGGLVYSILPWTSRTPWLGWITFFAISVTSWVLIRNTLAYLRSDFSMERIFGYGSSSEVASDALPSSEDCEHAEDEIIPDLLPSVPFEADDVLRVRAQLSTALATPPAAAFSSRGWLEWSACWLLNARQRRVVDFLRPSGPWNWAKGWIGATVILAIAGLLRASGSDSLLCAVIAGAGLVIAALPVFGGGWRGLDGITLFQLRTGLNSFVPVSYWEIAYVRSLLNTVRTIATLPLITLTARYFFTPPELDWTESLIIAVKACIVVISLQPFWTIYGFSKNSNDSNAHWWLTVGWIVTILATILVFVTGGTTIFILETFPSFICAGVMLGYAHAALGAYGLIYRFGWFDLMAKERPIGQ